MCASQTVRSLPEVIIESARADDMPSIRALIKEGRINPTSLEWRNFVVARHPHEGVIGCGQTRDAPFGSGRELKSLVVRKDYRGRGVANAIIHALEEREHGIVWGTCDVAMVPFYIRLGCEMPGSDETPGYYRFLRRVGALLHILTFGRSPRVAVLRMKID